ncbi:hypothetical protein, variant [Aphanomyces invadans]|uniref:Peroxisomal membrane protein PEX16 n=1 Tax=Aphanomyces invadans TaxID=157072 RepID=A0A024UA90_9STRA|nr:hypothetical protein, variant [Aphanomyces invadans]ETW03321.1 hypothetical protein, variant [Aphanomyces invadans]|eukprot:XP_008867550.1 hypothetical protein, variant [Aphanomyces invadans]
MTLHQNLPHDDVHPLLDKYNAWVLENESFARRLENVLYVVPMLVPAAVGNPDVVSEVGYSMGGLLKLYHDWVLYQVNPLSKEKTPSHSSWSVVQAARVPLSIISQVQVAAEMIALKTGGKQSRWNVIVVLELCKCVCKLVLLAHTKGQVLYKCGPYISCEVRRQDGEEYTGQRSGRVYRSSRPNQQPPTLSFLDPTYASGNEGATQTAAEVLHILRPVVYAVLCQRQSDRSWVPFLASFSTEIAGILLSTSVEAKRKRVKNDKVDEEYHRRKMCLFLYLLRNPVFSSVTEPVVEGVCNSSQPIPLLGRLIRFAVDNGLHYYQRRHFYTSAS